MLSGLTSAIAFIVSWGGILSPQIYLPFTPPQILPGAISQDIISVIASLGIVVCAIAIQRGVNRAWLIWLGLLGYLFYGYALYALDAIYNQFFLAYIAIVGLTVYTAIIFFAHLNLDYYQRITEPSIPRKVLAIYLLFLFTLFHIVWLSQILPAIGSGLQSGVNTVFVLDLAFFLPLLAICAVLLLHRKPFGDLLAPVILIKTGTLGVSVFLGELLKPQFGQTIDPFMVGLFAVMGFASLAFAGLTLTQFGQITPSSDLKIGSRE